MLCHHRSSCSCPCPPGEGRGICGSERVVGCNRVGRELMDLESYTACPSLLHASSFTEGPARPLPSITMHAAGASACSNVSVAILAQAISCLNVRGVFPVHELFLFCLVQVSTTQFCCFSFFLMARFFFHLFPFSSFFYLLFFLF